MTFPWELYEDEPQWSKDLRAATPSRAKWLAMQETASLDLPNFLCRDANNRAPFMDPYTDLMVPKPNP
jgi:hypothetical protein